MNKKLILVIALVCVISAGAWALDNTTVTSTTLLNVTNATTTIIDTTTTLEASTTTLAASTTTQESTTTTAEPTTTVTSSTVATTTTVLICNATTCDAGCVVCSDAKCHEPDYVCNEELNLEKYFPDSINKGVTQINIILRNTGNVDLKQISAELSGDGIKTLEKIPLVMLATGEKDYTFTKINATKSGMIDLVVKLYVGTKLKATLVKQLNVSQEKVEVSNVTTEAFNITALSDKIKAMRIRYFQLQQDYQNKKLQGFQVDIVYDTIKATDDNLNSAKFYLLDGDYRRAQTNADLAEDNLNNIENLLKSSQKPKATFGDKLKSNMVFIGSIAAALISIFTAYGLIKSHINKQKIKEIQQKIRAKNQKIEEHEEKIEEHEEKIEKTEQKLEETEKKVEKLEEEKNPKD